MIQPFGLTGVERTASAVMVLAGLAGLVLSVLGREVAVASIVLGQPLPGWFLPRPGRAWLVLQALLVIMAGVSSLLLSRWLTIVAVGILAGLVFITPVGLLTALPALWMLILVVPCYEAFWEFTPRWRGGDPRPGQWR